MEHVSFTGSALEFNGCIAFDDGSAAMVKRFIVLSRDTVILDIEIRRNHHVGNFLGVTGRKDGGEVSTSWIDLDAADDALEDIDYPSVRIKITHMKLCENGLDVKGSWDEWIENGRRDSINSIRTFQGTLFHSCVVHA